MISKRAIKKIVLPICQWQVEIPSYVLVCSGLLAVSPLGGISYFTGAVTCPASLAWLVGFLSNLLQERYFYRALMTVGYVLQNKARVIGAIPVAIGILGEAFIMIRRTWFGRLSNLRFEVNIIVINNCHFFGNKLEQYLKKKWIVIVRSVPGLSRKVQYMDDFLWQTGNDRFFRKPQLKQITGISIKKVPVIL